MTIDSFPSESIPEITKSMRNLRPSRRYSMAIPASSGISLDRMTLAIALPSEFLQEMYSLFPTLILKFLKTASATLSSIMGASRKN